MARLTDHLVDGMNRDEYQALAHEILDDLPLSDCKVIKRKIHAAVLQRNVSLYEIGRFLLARQILYVHIFKITEFTKGEPGDYVNGRLFPGYNMNGALCVMVLG